MNPSKLKESETVEFKESFKDDALKTLCAFANTNGGSLFIGVNDDSKLIGLRITDKAEQKIVNKIESVLRIQPAVLIHKDAKDEFLEIKVAKSKTPVDVRGRFYKRVGNTTREIDREGLISLLLKDVPWDSQIREDTSLGDLDPDLMNLVAKNYYNRQNESPEKIDGLQFCQHLGLIKEGKPTNAALVLFGINPQHYFPFVKIRIGRFKDDATILADHQLSGNLFKQLEEAERTIKSLINKRYIITGESFQRKEVWDYPIEAIREAILNAITHRNYHIATAEIQIKVYDDFIWFYNPGKLPEEITIDQLKKPHSSIRRNPLIAEAFFRAGHIEQFGSGTLRMIKQLQEAGHPDPEFNEQGNGFVVSFYASERPEIDDLFNERQIEAMNMAELEEIQASDLQEKFPEVSRKTITRDLTDLVEKEILTKTGKGKGTRYRMSKKFMGHF